MLSKKTEKALNEHLGLELEASLQYLAMASWCEKEGLEGSSNFFYGHAAEENEHFLKVFHYINEVSGYAKVPKINQPIHEFKSIREICERAYSNEQKVTTAIHSLVELAKKEEDHVTAEFLRFFVEEQKEEEVLFQRVLDKLNLIGDGGQSLYYIDMELEKLAAAKTN